MASQLQSLGFDGYALQYVSCPEGLKWFLKNINLHRTVSQRRMPRCLDVHVG